MILHIFKKNYPYLFIMLASPFISLWVISRVRRVVLAGRGFLAGHLAKQGGHTAGIV
jgi:hypothetical protein